jgi:membrane-associated protease RseP (regulator of RpoE activity)
MPRWHARPMPTLNLLLAIALVALLHVGTMAVVGNALGAQLQSVSFGFGPTVWRSARFHVRALPVGGSVRFLHTLEDSVPEDEEHRALDRRPTLAQLATVLSGCAVLLALALAVLGAGAVKAFVELPAQFFGGAISPLGDAQALMRQAALALQAAPFAVVLGVVAAKAAALNLLPLPALNGGAALAVLGRRLGVARLWPERVTVALFFVWLAPVAAWFVALCAYVFGS